MDWQVWVILAAVVLVLGALAIRRFSKLKMHAKGPGVELGIEGSTDIPAQTAIAVAPPAIAPEIQHDAPASKAEKSPREDEPAPAGITTVIPAADLQPSKIIDAIRSAPMLMRKQMQQHFENLPVKWSGTLHSAEDLGDGQIQIHMYAGDHSPAIFFKVKAAHYPGFGLLRPQHPVDVEGVIEKVTPLDIDLRDAKFVPSTEANTSSEPKKPIDGLLKTPHEEVRKLDVSLNFYHDLGEQCFIKIVANNYEKANDQIKSVLLVQPAKAEWKVLVPQWAPSVRIVAQDWERWTHSLPLPVPADGTLVFWVSGYVGLGIKESHSEGVIGQIFEFKIDARSGNYTIQVPLERRPSP